MVGLEITPSIDNIYIPYILGLEFNNFRGEHGRN